MVSKLYLDIPEAQNLKTQRILDSSLYNEDVDIKCARLEITPPGFDFPVLFEVEPYFNLVLNTANLGLAKPSKYTDLADLPDGVYQVKYSIAPNDKVWVEYEFLRLNSLLEQYYGLRCKLKLENIDPNRDQNNKMKQLLDIRNTLESAKIEVEWCGNRDRGMDLYMYASKQLSKLGDGQCTKC